MPMPKTMTYNRTNLYLLATAFISTLALTACSNTQIPEYILTDSELHQYQSGDQLTYGILALTGNADIAGALTHTFTTTDLVLPSLQTLETLTRTTTSENLTFPFTTPSFTQLENGNLILQAYTESGNTYWLNELLNENSANSTGEVFYTSPLSQITSAINFNSTLLICNKESNVCNNGGNTSLLISVPTVENIETSYAKFEAYKLSIEWTADIYLNDEFATIKNYSLTGTQWVYPPLGVVKFNYTLTSSTESQKIIGTLSATNIKIAVENKAN